MAEDKEKDGVDEGVDEDVDEEEHDEASDEALRGADDKAIVPGRDGGHPRTPGDAPAETAEGDEEDAGEEGDGGEEAAAQLGSDRYVLAGFFAAGMAAAYVLGRALQSAWVSASNKDWFSQSLPRLAAVPDDDKSTYSVILGGIVALVLVFRTYQRPDVRAWADEVAAELAKVVWPSRKDVTNYTFIVIVASTVATVYLALLDRLWAFVTNIVYGDGS
jgi:preprotein translocase subunit SecE